MGRAAVVVTGLCVISFIMAVSVREGRTKEVKEKGGTEIHLSKSIRRVLSAEMNAIQNAMANLVIAIPAANWSDIIETAGKMREGYIMKNKLSAKEHEKFRSSLPHGYLDIDGEYYQAAGNMVEAAAKGDIASVHSYYSKLGETCVRCHSVYARKRFPSFKQY